MIKIAIVIAEWREKLMIYQPIISLPRKLQYGVVFSTFKLSVKSLNGQTISGVEYRKISKNDISSSAVLW